MKYKAIKKFYCPIKQARVSVGEMVEVADENLDGYKQYIEIPKIEEIEKKIEEVEKKTKKK